MQIDFFAEILALICNRSAVASGKKLRWIIIANPMAGGFNIHSRWKKSYQALESAKLAVQANPQRDGNASAAAASMDGLILTEGPGHASKIAASVIREIASYRDADSVPFYLIVTAGGDGTSLEVLSELYRAPESVRSNFAVVRLPMGTGNDGAESHDLSQALELLIKPTLIKLMPALQLITAPEGPAALKGPYPAFNILSAGLDAYVTHMTNKMKGKLPGDFYKLWVDIASLLYDRLYKVDYLDVKALDSQGAEVTSFREKILLLAVGASGYRTYGSQKKILPDDRNVCALKQMPMFRKVALKGLFSTGGHADKPESIMFNAQCVEINGKYPILAQMDGEAILLQKEDFPIKIELIESVIPVLKLA